MAFGVMAGSTGLEPAASGVTGRRYNRLNYDPVINEWNVLQKWQSGKKSFPDRIIGGRNRDRTCDIQLVRLALSQLSYSPVYMAGSTGLEPAASGVTGRRYNRLNYDPANGLLYIAKWVCQVKQNLLQKLIQSDIPEKFRI